MVRRPINPRNRGRNTADPMEMQSDFNMGSAAPMGVGGVMQANAPRNPIGAEAEVLQGIASFGTKLFRDAAATKYNRLMMEGMMANQQGESLDKLDPGDNSWRLEGWRVMEGETAAAALLTAQQAEISQGLFELDPDAFRSRWAERAESVLSGHDERTQEIIREKMVEQMPTLVSQHMREHMAYNQRQSVDHLTQSIDVLSRDPANAGSLIAFARGEQGSGGLSTEARASGVIAGVVRAFENDNPSAFAILSGAGIIPNPQNPDAELSFTPEQWGQIRSAQQSFESRRRNNLDVTMFEQEQQLMQSITNGDFTDPMDAVRTVQEFYQTHNINMTAGEAQRTYDNASSAAQSSADAVRYTAEEARLRGDYRAVADATAAYIVDIESGGRREAVSPTGARSEWQVMDATNLDPGFGVLPAQNNTLAERARVGRDYWRAMVARYNGDLEAAAVAYNAGPGNADNWLKAGRNFDTASFTSEAARNEARGYVAKFNARYHGAQHASAAARAAAARTSYNETAGIVDEERRVAVYAATAPLLRSIDDAYKRGGMSDGAYERNRNEVLSDHNVAMTIAEINHRMDVQQWRANENVRERETSLEEEGKLRSQTFQGDVAAANRTLRQTLARLPELIEGQMPNGTRTELNAARIAASQAAREAYDQEIRESAARNNISDLEANYPDLGEQGNRMLDTAFAELAARDRIAAEASIASQNGTLGQASADAQEYAFQNQIERLNNESQRRRANGDFENEAAHDAWMETEMESFFIKSGHVPAEIRNANSAALRGQLVAEDGTVDQRAVDAISGYFSMKQRSPGMAAKMLDQETRVTAEGIIAATGGRPELFAGAVRDAWANGLNTPFTGRPDPNFWERSEVQNQIGNALHQRGLLGRVFSAPNALEHFGFSGEQEDMVREMLRHNIQAIHELNPRIDPRNVVGMAIEGVRNRMVRIGDDIVVDPTMGDLYQDTFGPYAESYRNQPEYIEKAIEHYLLSEPFRDEYLDGAPSTPSTDMRSELALIARALSLQGTDGMSERERIAMANWNGTPATNFTHVGNGMIAFDLQLSTDGTRIPIVLPLSKIGESWIAHEAEQYN